MTHEAVLAEILRARDPGRALGRAIDDPAVPQSLRSTLAQVDVDGLRIAALLVARLRFERLVQGSVDAAEWFDADPAAFSQAFRRYHCEVPPRACFAAGEAAQFAEWLDAQPG